MHSRLIEFCNQNKLFVSHSSPRTDTSQAQISTLLQNITTVSRVPIISKLSPKMPHQFTYLPASVEIMSFVPCPSTFLATKPLPSTFKPRLSSPRTNLLPSPLPLTRAQMQPHTTSDTTSAQQTEYLYFSYGSNMSRDKVKSRTLDRFSQITYTDVWIASVKEWELSFDLRGALPREPAMGSIRKQSGATVYGVVYNLDSQQSWDSLLKTEGVTHPDPAVNGYLVVQVTAECYKPETPHKKVTLTVNTLAGNPSKLIPQYLQPYIRPSRRYCDLLIKGAKSEQLPQSYIEDLEKIPVARYWSSSPLRFVMSACVPLNFLGRIRIVRVIRTPLLYLDIRLFGLHEYLVGQPKQSLRNYIFIALLKVVLFVWYSLFLIPVAILLICSPAARRLFKALRKISQSAEENRNKQPSKQAT